MQCTIVIITRGEKCHPLHQLQIQRRQQHAPLKLICSRETGPMLNNKEGLLKTVPIQIRARPNWEHQDLPRSSGDDWSELWGRQAEL